MLRQVRSLLLDPEVETLLAAPPRELAALGEVLNEPGYPLPDRDSPRIQLAAGIGLGRWARAARVQLLHGHGLKRLPLYVVAAKVAGLPLVVTLHNLVPNQSRRVSGVLLGQAKCVIAVSNAVAKTAGVPCRVIYNGIELSPFSSLPDKAEARALLGWPLHSSIVLSVARLSPEKGLSTLIQAAQGLALTVMIAGEGPERQRLEVLGGATLLGSREDVPLLMAAADLYCQPSLEEGLGLAVIEALAAGLPVVASEVGGLPELISHPLIGTLVPAGQVIALRETLQQLLAQPQRCREMGIQAKIWAKEHFSLEQMRRETREIYAQVK